MRKPDRNNRVVGELGRAYKWKLTPQLSSRALAIEICSLYTDLPPLKVHAQIQAPRWDDAICELV
jgi:hypothetical protein